MLLLDCIAHAKMERDRTSTDNIARKKVKPPPPRPPPPYVGGGKKIGPLKSVLTATNSSPVNLKPRIPRRPPDTSSQSLSRRDRSRNLSTQEDTSISSLLSDTTRQRSKSSTSLVFKEDLEKRLLSINSPPIVHKTKPPPRKPLPKYISTSSSPITSTSLSPLPNTILPVPRKIPPLTNSAPSTPLPDRPQPFKRHSAIQQQAEPNNRVNHYPAKHSTTNVHPEGYSYTKALHMACSKSTNMLHAPTVKVNLTSKSKYTPRPAPPRPPQTDRCNDKFTSSEEENTYAVPSHLVLSDDNFVIEPYATCHGSVNNLEEGSNTDSQSDFYVKMTSSSNSFTTKQINDNEDYVISDLAPQNPSQYMSLKLSKSANNINNSDNIYTDVQKRQPDNASDVYSIPTSTRVSSGFSSTSDGYLSLSVRREQGQLTVSISSETSRTRKDTLFY